MTTIAFQNELTLPTLDSASRNIMSTLKLWAARAEQRRQLRNLPDYLLDDMGISQEALQAEISKPFWK